MKCDKKIMRLYAVTDRRWLGDESLPEQVEKALRGGVSCVQLREKELSYDDFLKEAMQLKELCSHYKIPLIINDDVEVALACGADGIHIGQDDMSAAKARELIRNDMLLGVSVQTMQQAIKAENDGADYLGVGAVFSTSTKLDADYVPPEVLREICSAVSIPVVAIGGISESNISELYGSGIDGVALVSAIFAADDIENTCKRLRTLSENTFNTQAKGDAE